MDPQHGVTEDCDDWDIPRLVGHLTQWCTGVVEAPCPPIWLTKKGLSRILLRDDPATQEFAERFLRKSVLAAQDDHGESFRIWGGRMTAKVDKCTDKTKNVPHGSLEKLKPPQSWEAWLRIKLGMVEEGVPKEDVIKEVKYKVAMLASMHGEDALSREALAAIAQTRNDAAMSTPAVEMIITAAWNRHKSKVFFDTALNVGAVISAFWVASDIRSGVDPAEDTIWEIYLWFVLSMRAFQEMGDLATKVLWPTCTGFGIARAWLDGLGSRPIALNIFYLVLMVGFIISLSPLALSFCLIRYVTSDFTDLLFLVTGFVGMVNWETSALALFFGLLWMRLLFGLRTVNGIGQKLLPIFKAAKDTGSFAIVVAMSLAAGVHAYYTLGVRKDPSYLYAAVLQISRLGFLGDFDLFEFEGEDTVYKATSNDTWAPEDPEPSPKYIIIHLLFFIVGLGITVFLMNLLVGILGAAYDKHGKKAEQYFLQSRAEVMVKHGFPWWHRLWRFVCGHPKDDSDHRLWAVIREDLLRVDDDAGTFLTSYDDEDFSMRDHLKTLKKDMGKDLRTETEDIKKNLQNLTELVQRLVANQETSQRGAAWWHPAGES